MSGEYKIFMEQGGKIIVVLHPTCKITKAEILALLVECSFEEKDIFFMQSDMVKSEYNFDDQIVILPIDENIYENPDLELVARNCANGGATVVTVLGSGISYDGLHPIADKYGPQSNWSSEQLQSCIGTPLITTPKSSSGGEIQRGDKDPVKC